MHFVYPTPSPSPARKGEKWNLENDGQKQGGGEKTTIEIAVQCAVRHQIFGGTVVISILNTLFSNIFSDFYPQKCISAPSDPSLDADSEVVDAMLL